MGVHSVFDVVIRGGQVVDGTGSPGFRADVAIEGGLVVEIGDDVGRARQEIDADGHLVTPGWVDIHTHYDGQALWDPLLETSAAHGVTTALMGNCGVGFAPVQEQERPWAIMLMEGVEDIPARVLEAGIPWQWESFPEYLEALAAQWRTIDVGAQIPHAPLRVFTMGERGIDYNEHPTDDEMERMADLTAEAVQAGALGISTSRSRNHRASDGRNIPTFSASDRELLGLAAALRRVGQGVFEINLDNDDIDDDLRLLRGIAATSGRPVSAALIQRPGRPADDYRRVLEGFEAAAAEGLELWGQVAPRPTGVLLSLGGSMNPFAATPTFRTLAASNGTPLHERLRAPEVRARILTELRDVSRNPLNHFAAAYDLGFPARYDQPTDASLHARAVAEGVDVSELAYDVLAAGRVVYVPASNYVEGDLRAVREMLVHPRTVPGLADGGAHASIVADFDYPTFLLAYWGRDAPEDERLPVEWIVKRQAADTAALLGLTDRGVLAPGRRADINVIDFDALGSTQPAIANDLPGGGSRLVSRGTGYAHTLVNGEVTYVDGRHTGALPGRLARRGL